MKTCTAPVSPRPRTSSSRRRGFTLVLTLIVLAAITLLVLGLFANVTSESSTAMNYDNAFRAQTAVRSGLSRVEALLQRGTWSDDYLVLEHLQNPPPANAIATEEQWRNRRPVLTLARPVVSGDTTGTSYTATWEYVPLTSGVTPPPNTTGARPSLPTTALTARNDPNVKPAAPNQVATALPKRMPWQPAQDSFWEVLYEDQDTDGDPKTPPVKVPVSRYCFHVEDLQGLLSLDHAGNPGDAVEAATAMRSRQHEREKVEVFETPTSISSPRLWYAGLAPGLRTPDDDLLTNDRRWALNQAGLYSLFDPALTSDTSTADNLLIVARQTQRSGSTNQVASLLISPDAWKPLLMKEDIANPWPTWLQRASIQTKSDGTPIPDLESGRLPNSAARRLEENTITGLQPYYEYPLVPVQPGIFAYPRMPKMNLNRVLTQVQQGTLTQDQAVKLISGHIHKHLPTPLGTPQNRMDGFAKRAGAFPYAEPNTFVNAPAYLQNLAAGILDYADTDCLPTVQENLYRGFDAAPVIHEHILMHRWESSAVSGTRRIVRYTATFYYEIWNMSNRPISGVFKAEYVNKGSIQIGVGNYRFEEESNSIMVNKPGRDPKDDLPAGGLWMPLYEAHSTSGMADITKDIITLRPNEMTVIGSLPITYDFFAGLAATTVPEITVFDDNDSYLRLAFKPVLAQNNPNGMVTNIPQVINPTKFHIIERTGAGVERNQRRLKLTPLTDQQQYSCNPFNFSTGDSSDPNSRKKNNNGDPRSSFYMKEVQTLAKYADTPKDGAASPYGRNKRQNATSNDIYGEVFVSRWGDRGHDGPLGVYPGSNAFSPFHPTVLAKKPAYTTAQRLSAPMRISNAGRYFSVTELGNIYDPIFWDPNGNAANPASGGDAWTLFHEIGNSATPNGSFSGGHTLKIGRPEHPLFRWNLTGGDPDNVDRRLSASTLLDLFHCGISTVGSVTDATQGADNLRDLTGPLIEINGHVNVNTATKDTLKALLAGGVKTDPWITNSSSSAQDISSMADAIVRDRPFVTTAEVAEKTRAPTGYPIFGATQLMKFLGAGSEWNDTAMEEAFARLYNSTTVRSRHFRVYITGQAVRPRRSAPSQLEVLSTRSRVVHVFVEPVRNATTGLIEDQRIRITHEQDL